MFGEAFVSFFLTWLLQVICVHMVFFLSSFLCSCLLYIDFPFLPIPSFSQPSCFHFFFNQFILSFLLLCYLRPLLFPPFLHYLFTSSLIFYYVFFQYLPILNMVLCLGSRFFTTCLFQV